MHWHSDGYSQTSLARTPRHLQRTLASLTALLLCLPGLVSADTEATQSTVDSTQQQVPVSSPLRSKTDQELTELTAQWGQLNPAERRVLLAEVRRRMADRQRVQVRSRNNSLVTRRYGRVTRKADGSVVVETTVVRPDGQAVTEVRQQKPAQSTGQRQRTGARITFGFGFERRARRDDEQQDVTQTASQTASPEPPVEQSPQP